LKRAQLPLRAVSAYGVFPVLRKPERALWMPSAHVSFSSSLLELQISFLGVEDRTASSAPEVASLSSVLVFDLFLALARAFKRVEMLPSARLVGWFAPVGFWVEVFVDVD